MYFALHLGMYLTVLENSQFARELENVYQTRPPSTNDAGHTPPSTNAATTPAGSTAQSTANAATRGQINLANNAKSKLNVTRGHIKMTKARLMRNAPPCLFLFYTVGSIALDTAYLDAISRSVWKKLQGISHCIDGRN